jgi:uncharacterized protein YlzI (FlbEa/FlbD family)
VPNGFITLTISSTVQPGEIDIAVEEIACYEVNPAAPNGGSTVTLCSSGTMYAVTEKVAEIRQKIAEEKAGET